MTIQDAWNILGGLDVGYGTMKRIGLSSTESKLLYEAKRMALDALNEVQRYQELKEKNALFIVPCSIGDELYVLKKFGGYQKGIVTTFDYNKYNGFVVLIQLDDGNETMIPFSQFKHNAFATKEQADEYLATSLMGIGAD